MKRLTGTLLAALLSMTFMGCNNNTSSVNVSNNSSANTTITNQTNDTENNETTSDVYLPNTFKVLSKEIYVDGPNYQEIEEGFTRLFIVHEQKYCAFTAALKGHASSLSEAHDVAFAKLQQNLVNYEGGLNYISVTSDKEVTVNGIDTYYFEGTINYGTDNIHDGYAVGYAFIMDGVPCEIVGSVIDDEQSADTIQEIKDYADAMMKSVRTTE